MSEKGRLFFAFQVQAPWPSDCAPDYFPNSLKAQKFIAPDQRHLTLAFLGLADKEKLLAQLKDLPLPPWPVGQAAKFNHFLPLPPKKPSAMTWQVEFFPAGYFSSSVLTFQHELSQALIHLGYPVDQRPFLPHVTVARAPANRSKANPDHPDHPAHPDHSALLAQWQTHFQRLPLYLSDLHLYESTQEGYIPLWTHSFLPPFTAVDHTADEAFLIRGATLAELYRHAHLALAFSHPPLLHYFKEISLNHLDDIIYGLNRQLTELDKEEGSPFKAVSYHGSIAKCTHRAKSAKDTLNDKDWLEWEMIIDV